MVRPNEHAAKVNASIVRSPRKEDQAELQYLGRLRLWLYGLYPVVLVVSMVLANGSTDRCLSYLNKGMTVALIIHAVVLLRYRLLQAHIRSESRRG